MLGFLIRGLAMSLAFMSSVSIASAQIVADWMESEWGVSVRPGGGDEALDGTYPGISYKSDVANFDVNAFANQVASIPNLAWVQVNLTNGAFGDRFMAPLVTIENVNPLSTPSRDLFEEIADALDARGIRTVAYVATQGPAMLKHGAKSAYDYDPDIPGCKKNAQGEGAAPKETDADTTIYCSAAMNRWRDYVLTNYTGTQSLYRKFELAMAQKIIRPFSIRYGTKIDAWWFDHAGFGDPALLRSSALAGNPDAPIAFNLGQKVPLTNNNPGLEDYTFGHPTPVIQAVVSDDVNLPMIESIETTGPIFYGPNNEESLGHVFFPMQENWAAGQIVFSPDKAAAWLQRVLDAGGSLTWAISLDKTTWKISEPQARVMAYAATYSGLDKGYDFASGTTSLDLQGAAIQVDGVRGNILRFAPTGDTASTPGYSGILGTRPRTVSFWIKTNDDTAKVVEWGKNTSGARWRISLVGGQVKLLLHGANVSSTQTIDDNQWHHVAVVSRNGQVSGVDIYIDGQLDTGGTNGTSFSTQDDGDIVFGGDFVGSLDDIEIFERALSAGEVDDLASTNQYEELSLGLHYRMNDSASGDVVADASIYPRNGLAENVGLGTLDNDRGTVSQFIGSGRIHATENLADAAVARGYNGVSGADPRTISLWVKTIQSDAVFVQWGNHVPTDGEQVIFRLHNGKLRFNIKGGYIDGSTTISNGQWHHIAVTTDDESLANAKLYVDGQLETISGSNLSEDIDTYVVNSTYDAVTGVLTLRSRDVLIGSGYTGLMDDLRIHVRELSAAEIAALATQ